MRVCTPFTRKIRTTPSLYSPTLCIYLQHTPQQVGEGRGIPLSVMFVCAVGAWAFDGAWEGNTRYRHRPMTYCSYREPACKPSAGRSWRSCSRRRMRLTLLPISAEPCTGPMEVAIAVEQHRCESTLGLRSSGRATWADSLHAFACCMHRLDDAKILSISLEENSIESEGKAAASASYP